uniref:Tectonin beta-propeller repeat-containing protein 1 n=1 Tax=Arion vulgaris TaxID=1028688 RepID=A0A0B7B5U6_9EUPU
MFGACFIPDMCKTDDAKLYTARPGCRLWLSDVKGVVLNTHIFSEPLSSAVPEIMLLSAGRLQVGQPEFQFGVLKCFRGREIVTWSSCALVVLDPESNRVVARQSRLSGIVDVAVVDDTGEIFLLRRHAEARVVRIAATSELKVVKAQVLPVLPPVVAAVADKPEQKDEKEKESTAQFLFKKFTNPLKHLEKSIRSDNKQEPDLPATVRNNTITSPDLPPVVRLSSPELEGVRMFTGTTIDTDANMDIALIVVPDKESTPGLPVLPVLMSASSSDVVAASATTSPYVLVSSPAMSLCPDSQYVQIESTVTSKNPPEEMSIVYSHRMKKHKKRKGKEALLSSSQNQKDDDDSISHTSTSSQHSDDTTVISQSSNSSNTPITGHNTLPSSSGHIPIIVDTNSHTVTSDALVHDVTDSCTEIPVLDSNILFQSQTIGAAAAASVEKSHHSISSKNSSTDDVSNSVVSSQLSDSFNVPVNASSSVNNRCDTGSHSIYESSQTSSNLRESILSECDQHLETIKQVKKVIADDTTKQRQSKDVTKIVENAIANLDKSRTSTSNMESEGTKSSLPEPQSIPTLSRLTSQMSVQDIYAEIDVIESTDPFHKGYRKDQSADDFYSLFLDTSPESPVSAAQPLVPDSNRSIPSEATPRSTEMQDVAERRLANTWSEFMAPANIYSLALSNNHIWFTDKSENIYYSSVANSKGIQWRKASGHANQISVSPSGHIVWRLHRGVVYAGTKISVRHPEGLKWVEAVRDVAIISADNDCAWFVMYNGDVMMQRRLSLERPCYKSQKVECHYKVKHIIARYGIVWAITDNLALLVRTGVSNELPEGSGWEQDTREVPPYLFSYVGLDNENIGWAIDVLGQIWFCDGVTREQPFGRRLWWQVPLSEYIMHDVTTLDIIRGLARKFDPTKLSSILSTNKGGLIVAGSQGVWLAIDFRNVLQVCRGNVQGYHWLEAQPAQMSPSSSWKQVCANMSYLDWGLIWAQHANGDVFTFKHARSEATVVPNCNDLCCISVGPTATWALSSSGAIFVREGMGPQYPRGTGWVELDISQLGDAHLVYISCNSLYVWAVEAEGTVYQRIGAKPPSENNLSPAWLAIDTFAVVVFTKVHTGPLDWMVWAIDNCRLPYARIGITENMPIGQEWVNVPGIQAMDLALTSTGVWALTPNGEIFFRYGITRDRPCGNYWKKIPGIFMKISASANDELWGINTEGQLMQCSVRHLTRQQDQISDQYVAAGTSLNRSISEDVDWEIV